MRHYDSTRRN